MATALSIEAQINNRGWFGLIPSASNSISKQRITTLGPHKARSIAARKQSHKHRTSIIHFGRQEVELINKIPETCGRNRVIKHESPFTLDSFREGITGVNIQNLQLWTDSARLRAKEIRHQ